MTADIIPFPARATKKTDAQLYAEAFIAQKQARGELPAPRTLNAQGARQVTAEEERAEAAARLDEFYHSGEADRMLAEMRMDSAEREFLIERGMTEDEASELMAVECSCSVCQAGGSCVNGPIGTTIGELMGAAYDQGLSSADISPKNRRVLLKAATELAARLAA